jgi:hypothetical protein
VLDIRPFSLIFSIQGVESAAIVRESTCRKTSSKTFREGFGLNLLIIRVL